MLKKEGKEHKGSIKNPHQELPFAILSLVQKDVQDSSSPPKGPFSLLHRIYHSSREVFSSPWALFHRVRRLYISFLHHKRPLRYSFNLPESEFIPAKKVKK